MFSYRLVRLIESHADTLAAGLERKVTSSDYVSTFRNIPAHELRNASTRSIVTWAIGCWVITRKVLSSAIGKSARGGHRKRCLCPS